MGRLRWLKNARKRARAARDAALDLRIAHCKEMVRRLEPGGDIHELASAMTQAAARGEIEDTAEGAAAFTRAWTEKHGPAAAEGMAEAMGQRLRVAHGLVVGVGDGDLARAAIAARHTHHLIALQ